MCVLAALLVSGIVSGLVLGWNRAFPRRHVVYRIGYAHFPPLLVNNGSGPKGFAVEVVQEAARRRDISLEWVPIAGGPEPYLREGKLDLYPVFAVTADRRHIVHISEAWWESPLALIVDRKTGFKTAEELDGRRIGITAMSVTDRMVRKIFPRSTYVRKTAYEDVLATVCKGEADAAFLTLSLYLDLLQQGAKGCEGAALAPLMVAEASIAYGIGASQGNERIADELAAEIADLTYDGTLSRIGARSGELVSNQAQLVRKLSQARRNRGILAAVAAICALVTLIVLWQNRRVRQARRAADRARKAESEFLAHVSHEIRTPMNGVLGMLGLALETNPDAEMQEYLETANHSALALMSVLNDILDFSKIDAGRLDLEHIEFSPATVVAQSIRTLSHEARKKGLSIAEEIAPDVPGICMGDPNRLRQVLLNLIGNAIKFTARGSITVKLGLGRLSDRDVALSFEVCDTGVGIPVAKQTAIFDAFAQADRSTTRRFGGTGLGLAIASRLVELMNGRIWVKSEPGKGSTFCFVVVLGRLPELRQAAVAASR